MKYIRKATASDLYRIAEMVVFNYRLNFYPIFRNDAFYFNELQVGTLAETYRSALESMWVFDDGTVKGFIQIKEQEICKLFVEPVLQGKSIGSALMNYALHEQNATFLWALEKNEKAIRFYKRHGFHVTTTKKFEEGTTEYLVRLER